MKITCPFCKKKFNVDASLISSSGRLLKCGSCDSEWFYKESETSPDDINIEPNMITEAIAPIDPTPSVENSQEIQIPKETETIISQAEEKMKKTSDNKIENQFKKTDKIESNSISSFLSYLVVFIISFIAFIILLDTFKAPLSNIFPGLENLLLSLYETLKDIKLFIIDLT